MLEKAGGGPAYGFYQYLFWVGYGYFPGWLGPAFMMINPLKHKPYRKQRLTSMRAERTIIGP
tara:strand:+ start:336 stop:521 length:186 start_codon:yes stop_codon:yes gene_type:complete